MKLIISIFLIGTILPSSSVSAQKRLYFGADVEPLALDFSGYGWSVGIHAGYFGDEHSFIEIEGRGGTYAAEENNVKVMFFEPFSYRMMFTSLGLKVGFGSSYRSKFRIYYFLGGDLYTWGAVHDVNVNIYDNGNPPTLVYSFHAEKYPVSSAIIYYLAGIKVVVPVGPVEADATMKLPNFLGFSTPIKGGSDEAHRPPESFFLLSFGIRF
ncbi:MAG: hypothetical protein ACP5US_06570 [Candidatus Kryptoniota bacterium]